MKRSPMKRSKVLLKRGTLRQLGKSPLSVTKRRIQAVLRQIVIKRDGGCLLKGYGSCTEVLQAEHLISRSNSATFGDTRNLVCLCTYHHLWFKKQHGMEYWRLIEEKIGPARWTWLQLAQADRSAHKVDWRLTELALQAELAALR